VLGHECGHIKNGDMSTNMHMIAMLSGFNTLYGWGANYVNGVQTKISLLRSSKTKTSDMKLREEELLRHRFYGSICKNVGAFLSFTGNLLRLAQSRNMEFDADEHAANINGASNMISALQKIAISPTR
jgi:Zn-dependent protease with chaperone function